VPPIRDARRSLAFGIAHGLAGSGAIVVLMVAAAATRREQLAYFTAFGAGTILGMLGVSAGVAVLVRGAAQRGRSWATWLHLGTAAASIAIGVLLAAETTGAF
jgi:sulfite exporter TauE/SafE